MSWGRVNHPNEVFKVGDQVKVKVLKFDRERGRVSLGYKQTMEDPWTTAPDRYPPGTRVRGKVVSLTDYGAFVELEQGVEGLIHVSEMSWSKKIKHPSKLLTVGQEVECQVLGLDQEAHRISLGLKQVESNPWEQLAEKYPIGSKITGKVRNLTEFGAFVEVEEGIDGLIHISDLSWTKRVKHPSEVLKKGDTVEAIVLNIDAENQRLSLGLKQLATDVWDDYFAHHKAGDIVEGKIVRLTTFGAFVELAEGVEGLVHVSELDEKRIEKPEEHFKPGDVFPMKIIKVQEADKKIGLSIRAVKQDEYAQDVRTYRESSSGSERSTLGDVFRAAQAAAAAREKEQQEE
jgi:small subunit ribosomal protein S1